MSPSTVWRMGCLLFATAVLVTGCGPSEAHLVGQVTLDNQLLVDGQLQLEPVDLAGPTDGVIITNGKYEIKMPPGTYKVRINASKVVGQRDAYQGVADSPKIDLTESIIPAKYNVATELQVELKLGPNQHDFTLTSEVPAEQ